MKPHKIIRNLLSQLKIKCRNEEHGCEEIVSYEKLEVHEEVECEYEFVPCQNKEYGCTQTIRREHMKKHLEEQCVYNKVKCMYCNKKFTRLEIRNHLTNCDEAELTCQYCKG
jgi:hypothetical protein